VRDRTVYQVPVSPVPVEQPAPPPPEVEVTPLPRPAPIQPLQAQEYSEPVALADEPELPDAPFADAAPAPVETVPPPAPEPAPLPPAELAQEGNQAVQNLLASAVDYVDTGELDKAGAALERALRIEPRNARLWYNLAQIRLNQQQFQQAESLAFKSNSLTDDPTLQALNWGRVIAPARRAAGDDEGADAAEAQASVLQP